MVTERTASDVLSELHAVEVKRDGLVQELRDIAARNDAGAVEMLGWIEKGYLPEIVNGDAIDKEGG